MASLFILLLALLLVALVGLSVMRGDAQRLVLDPLQRMLRIVIRCKSKTRHKATPNTPHLTCAFFCPSRCRESFVAYYFAEAKG